jgi:predicted ATP-binding protein involved in virulence
MEIAAFFIMEHEYITYKPQVMNLGGKFIYNVVIKKGGVYTLSRTPNPKKIEDFFSITSSEIKIGNVSAIVGQNGVGKSTMLDVIRKSFVEKSAALPFTSYFLLVENDKSEVFFISSSLKKLHFENNGKINEVKKLDTKLMQTIFYSPHLDFRFNPNFDEIDYFDISADNYLELDLEGISDRGKKSNGTAYSIKQELLFKNSVRQIVFLASPLVTKKKVFNELFNFPTHGEAMLEFRDTFIDDDPRNVPRSFLTPFEMVRKKIDEEANDYVKIRKSDKNGNITNQIEVNQYLLKRDILKYILSVVHRQMDVSNNYLSHSDFNMSDFKTDFEAQNALDSFYSFFRNSFINTVKGRENPFDIKLIEALISKVYDVIEKIKSIDAVQDNRIIASSEDAIKILELQKELVFEISDYYNKQSKENSKDYTNINFLVQGVIYYFPAKKKLSSGENALLNFFSKLYDFLDLKLNVKTNPKKQIQTFILLLDEADLGFHPTWKKKFVKALVSSLPYFFEEYSQKPSLQIIFTTHDPLTLSDLPNSNIVYLLNDNGHVGMDEEDKRNTFGANITDLLADSFFLSDGLIGDFAKDKIKGVIAWLDSPDDKDNSEYYEKVIQLIDEPIVKRKLAEMFDKKMQTNLELNIIEKQIEELNKKREELKK